MVKVKCMFSPKNYMLGGFFGYSVGLGLPGKSSRKKNGLPRRPTYIEAVRPPCLSVMFGPPKATTAVEVGTPQIGSLEL